MAWMETLAKIFDIINKNWIIAVFIVCAVLYLLFQFTKKRKTKKLQKVQVPMQIAKPAVQITPQSIVQPVQPVVQFDTSRALAELQKEFGGEPEPEADLIKKAQLQMQQLDKKTTEALLTYAQKMKISRDKILQEEKTIFGEGEKLLKRKRLLEQTRHNVSDKISLTDI